MQRSSRAWLGRLRSGLSGVGLGWAALPAGPRLWALGGTCAGRRLSLTRRNEGAINKVGVYTLNIIVRVELFGTFSYFRKDGSFLLV